MKPLPDRSLMMSVAAVVIYRHLRSNIKYDEAGKFGLYTFPSSAFLEYSKLIPLSKQINPNFLFSSRKAGDSPSPRHTHIAASTQHTATLTLKTKNSSYTVMYVRPCTTDCVNTRLKKIKRPRNIYALTPIARTVT